MKEFIKNNGKIIVISFAIAMLLFPIILLALFGILALLMV